MTHVERRKLIFSFSPMCIVLFKMLIYHFLTLFAQFKEQTKFLAHSFSSLKTHQAQDYVMLKYYTYTTNSPPTLLVLC